MRVHPRDILDELSRHEYVLAMRQAVAETRAAAAATRVRLAISRAFLATTHKGPAKIAARHTTLTAHCGSEEHHWCGGLVLVDSRLLSRRIPCTCRCHREVKSA